MRPFPLSRFRPFLLVCLLGALLPFRPGHTAPEAVPALADAGDGIEIVDSPEPDLEQIIKRFRSHCVRVFIHGRTHEGRFPTGGDYADDIRHERPTPLGGYWWDERHVVIPDSVLPDHFIERVEVALPGSDRLYPARVAGRFIMLQAMLVEVLPDRNGELPNPDPLEFMDWEDMEASVLSYAWKDGDWRITADTGLGSAAVTDSGLHLVSFTTQGVFVTDDGQPVALAFGDSALVDFEFSYWAGRDVPYTPLFMRDESDAAASALDRRLAEAVLETRFRLRVRVDDEDEEEALHRSWMVDAGGDAASAGEADVRAAGFVVGKRHLLVPLALSAEGIARIEGVTVVTAEGREIAASFHGALRDYLAVLIETAENLPTDNVPEGFGLLNPLPPAMGDAALLPIRPTMRYFQRRRIDYSHGRRRELADYDRWLGTFRGYRGDPVVLTRTNEGDGSLAFDTEGNLVAVALTPRLLQAEAAMPRASREKATPAFRPVDFLQARLRADDAFDPTLLPVDEDQGQRLVDLGVEFQPLDKNLAARFHASGETRGGQIGLLLNHVYPGSPASGLGLRESDILLRIRLEGKREPMELRSSGFSPVSGFDIGDLASESFQSFIRFMPPPWPSRNNVVSTLLTAAGPGRKGTLEYLREGKVHRADFVTAYFQPDYRSAKKEIFPRLGLTVKPVTFEVARYFGREDQSGVIVSRVEVGGRGSVAGLHHYLLVTHVDGRPVAGIDDFRARTRAFEAGEALSLELTVDGFGKTRLVKIE